jgi:hypothetical protein
MASWSHLLPIQSPRPGASSSGRGALLRGEIAMSGSAVEIDTSRFSDLEFREYLLHMLRAIKQELADLREDIGVVEDAA